MRKFNLNVSDLAIINKVVTDCKIEAFRLVYENSSGIGYTIDLEYESKINGYDAVVRIPICGSMDW